MSVSFATTCREVGYGCSLGTRVSSGPPNNMSDSFIELYNAGSGAVDVSNWTLTEHATQEAVVGRVALAGYIRKEAADQGQASVRIGSPLIDSDHVAAEFWVTRTNEGENWTTAGCFIARLGPDGRCTVFREYWFDVEGHIGAYDGWGD